MSPFRLVFIAGSIIALLGAGYLSWYGVGRESRDMAAQASSIRTGSPGGGVFFGSGRIK